MKNIKYLIFTLFLFALSFLDVNADVCDSNDIARLKEVAKNVEVSYTFNVDYVDEFGDKTYDNFNLEIIGITNEVYVYFSEGEFDDIINYEDTIDGGISFDDYYSGNHEVFIASKNCGNLLKKIEITIPKFNVYSLDSRCNDSKYSNLDICNQWYEDVDEIDSENLDYYFGLEDKNSLFKIRNFIKNNLWIIIFGCILCIIVVVGIIFIHKKRWSLE